MKYNVHLYVVVRVKVAGIEASTAAEAMKQVDDGTNFHELLDNHRPGMVVPIPGGPCVEYVEWDESAPTGACVDLLLDNGEIDYDNTVWLDGDGKPAESDEKKTVTADTSN
jgi:hypothetical protein